MPCIKYNFVFQSWNIIPEKIKKIEIDRLLKATV